MDFILNSNLINLGMVGQIKLLIRDTVVLYFNGSNYSSLNIIGLDPIKYYYVGIAMNGDINAANPVVIGCDVGANSLYFRLNKSWTGGMRINYILFQLII